MPKNNSALKRRTVLKSASLGAIGIGAGSTPVSAISRDDIDKIERSESGLIQTGILIIDDMIIYGVENNLKALSVDGEHLWEVSLEGGFIQRTPVNSNSRIFVNTYENIFSISGQNGDILWRGNGSYSNIGRPTVSSNLVVFSYNQNTDENTKVIALDSDNGDLQWSIKTNGHVPAYVRSNDDNLYIFDKRGDIYSVHESGTVNWSRQLHSRLTSPPVLFNDRIFHSTESGKIYSVDAKNGDIKWEKTAENPSQTLSTHKDGILILSRDSRIHAIRSADGSELWSAPVDGSITGLDTSSKHIAYGTTKGVIGVLNIDDRRKHQEYKNSLSYRGGIALNSIVKSPKIHGDDVYVAALGKNQPVSIGGSV